MGRFPKIAVLFCLGAIGWAMSDGASITRVAAQPSPGLATGTRSARSGVHALVAGFAPDPMRFPFRAGGGVFATDFHLGAGCRGYVAAEPDIIFDFSGRASLLRFFVRSGSDVSLLVNDPQNRWRCNDDLSPGEDNRPMVDVFSPREGQYGIWVGTHARDESVQVELFVTGSRTERP